MGETMTATAEIRERALEWVCERESLIQGRRWFDTDVHYAQLSDQDLYVAVKALDKDLEGSLLICPEEYGGEEFYTLPDDGRTYTSADFEAMPTFDLSWRDSTAASGRGEET